MTSDNPTKRSRRVVLTMMGTVAVGTVSAGFAPRFACGPGLTAVRGLDGRLYCRGASYGGFGGYGFRAHGHGGHGHFGGG